MNKIPLAIILIVFISCTSIAAINFFLQQHNPDDTFDVAFTYYGQKGETGRFATVDEWGITIYKLKHAVLRDVDVFTSYGKTTKLQAHYEYLSANTVILEVLQVCNWTLYVDIYWEGGHEGFYCDPLE